MCANAELRGIDSIVVRDAALRQILPCRDHDLDEEEGLGVRRLPARERHQIVDDSVSQPRASLDLAEVRAALR